MLPYGYLLSFVVNVNLRLRILQISKKHILQPYTIVFFISLLAVRRPSKTCTTGKGDGKTEIGLFFCPLYKTTLGLLINEIA